MKKLKRVKCEYCDQRAHKRYYVPIRVQGRKKPFMTLRTCEICGLYIRRLFPIFIKQYMEKVLKIKNVEGQV